MWVVLDLKNCIASDLRIWEILTNKQPLVVRVFNILSIVLEFDEPDYAS